VTFHSNASNLVPNDTNAAEDVFEHDRVTGQTIRISTATDGTQATDASGENYWESAVSADGSIIVFTSKANNLVGNDTNTASDIFVYSRMSQDQWIYLPLVMCD
jgi:Tol biopolymer transport system component